MDALMPVEYKLNEIQCRVCKKEVDKKQFQSVFEANQHYKTTKCDCGNNITIPVTFAGSGHDEWDGHIEKKRGEEASIERKLRMKGI
jgi:hypothetical protein